MDGDTGAAAPRGRVLWGRVVAAALIGSVAVVACAVLGWWQWSRASTTGATVLPEPPVAIDQVLRPAEPAGPAIGRQVRVAGEWADVPAAVVPGREVDGVAAEMLVRALIVDAETAGGDGAATLAVVVGWRPEADDAALALPSGRAVLEGYLRAAEAAGSSSTPAEDPPDGATWATGLATSELAQRWPAPLYGALLVSYAETPGWRTLAPLEPTRETNVRSIAYAVEWWLFGAFALFIAVRWIRDNGRARPEATDPAAGAREDRA